MKDVLVKLYKFIFPIDFIMLDIEEDKDIHTILGHDFLSTGRGLINVLKFELNMRDNGQKVTFNV